jgi:hypothetical protein
VCAQDLGGLLGLGTRDREPEFGASATALGVGRTDDLGLDGCLGQHPLELLQGLHASLGDDGGLAHGGEAYPNVAPGKVPGRSVSLRHCFALPGRERRAAYESWYETLKLAFAPLQIARGGYTVLEELP